MTSLIHAAVSSLAQCRQPSSAHLIVGHDFIRWSMGVYVKPLQ